MFSSILDENVLQSLKLILEKLLGLGFKIKIVAQQRRKNFPYHFAQKLKSYTESEFLDFIAHAVKPKQRKMASKYNMGENF